MILYGEPGLTGLELWRGISRKASLHDLHHAKHLYFPALRDFLVALHQGTAQSPDDRETERMWAAKGFERVLLAGGEASHPLAASAMAAVPLPFEYEIHHSGPFAGLRGARRILAQQGWPSGVALDLGQTQLKIMTASGDCRLIPRDTSQLPFGADSLDATTARTRLRELLAGALGNTAPEGVVLGLPVEITTEGVARPSTYPGLFGPLESVFEGLFRCPWIAVNDAVLAAAGFRPESKEKRLIVTLGFGVGGALWDLTST